MKYAIKVISSREGSIPTWTQTKRGWEALCITLDNLNAAFTRLLDYSDYSCYTYVVEENK